MMNDGQALSIGGRPIGDGHPAYVIAEAGVNHNGDVEQALRLVDAAKQVGADAVKFQMFVAEELVTRDAPTAAYQQQGGETSQQALLAKLELTVDDFACIRRHCAECGLHFIATPFGVNDVARLVELGVPAIKLASTDLDTVPLVRAAVRTNLPLIISTGAALESEIAEAVNRLRILGVADRVVLLHCVSAYPTPIELANLRAVATLRARFDTPAGLSDHTTSTQTGAWAVAAGACVLEKHFTLDHNLLGPDHAMSLEPQPLREYIANVRTAESALGTGRLGMNEIEAEVRSVARKSVCAGRAIPAGTSLTDDVLTAKRPGGGISPAQIDALIGRVADVDIPAGTAIAWDMLR